jgi:hypothetical protein
MLDAFMGQAGWLPDEGKKALREWMDSYKKGCQDFKSMVDANYEKVESYFTEGE